MSRSCDLTGVRAQTGRNVPIARSQTGVRTLRRFVPNIQNVSVLSDALGKVSLKLAVKTIRSIAAVMRCKGLHGGTVALALALQACGGMKDAGSVADKFVDRYYVESDQDGVLPLTTGVASMRLKDGRTSRSSVFFWLAAKEQTTNSIKTATREERKFMVTTVYLVAAVNRALLRAIHPPSIAQWCSMKINLRVRGLPRQAWHANPRLM